MSDLTKDQLDELFETALSELNYYAGCSCDDCSLRAGAGMLIDALLADSPEVGETPDHVLQVSMGEYTRYHLTCNLTDEAPCHMTCEAHPEGHDNDDLVDSCVMRSYAGGCIIAEWVNDGGIETVDFDHTIELPVSYQWNASHDYPSISVSGPLGESNKGEK